MPPFHWWRTVFFLIPAIAVYTIVLGTMSLASSFFDRSGRFAHRCARAWSWLILATTGVSVAVAGSSGCRAPAYVFVANHQSIYDIPVLFWTLPFQLRILAKESLGASRSSAGTWRAPGTCSSIARIRAPTCSGRCAR